ncbi:unnamed protein product [Absidia cylindrospora]
MYLLQLYSTTTTISAAPKLHLLHHLRFGSALHYKGEQHNKFIREALFHTNRKNTSLHVALYFGRQGMFLHALRGGFWPVKCVDRYVTSQFDARNHIMCCVLLTMVVTALPLTTSQNALIARRSNTTHKLDTLILVKHLDGYPSGEDLHLNQFKFRCYFWLTLHWFPLKYTFGQ